MMRVTDLLRGAGLPDTGDPGSLDLRLSDGQLRALGAVLLRIVCQHCG